MRKMAGFPYRDFSYPAYPLSFSAGIIVIDGDFAVQSGVARAVHLANPAHAGRNSYTPRRLPGRASSQPRHNEQVRGLLDGIRIGIRVRFRGNGDVEEPAGSGEQ